jgi:hypothetical protein
MFQRMRDWWTLQTKPEDSPQYEAVIERRSPGSTAARREARRRREEAWERERVWWESVVAMQEAGRVEEVETQTRANMHQISSFVLEPLECLALLYGREVDRLLALGDVPAAHRAARQAMSLMQEWAAGSSSGGEGAARMTSLNRLEKELDAKLAAHPA